MQQQQKICAFVWQNNGTGYWKKLYILYPRFQWGVGIRSFALVAVYKKEQREWIALVAIFKIALLTFSNTRVINSLWKSDLLHFEEKTENCCDKKQKRA